VASALVTSFLAITNNFIWNDLWTFNKMKAKGLGARMNRWAKFALARSVGFLLGLGLLAIFVELIGMHYLVVTIMVIGILILCNYVFSAVWVWGKRNEPKL